MAAPKSIIFTVTNDLNFDQRMIRICQSMAAAGYAVTLIGRQSGNSEPLLRQPFAQQRVRCFFEKGFFFYAEYNLRLLFVLLFKKTDLICAIDLDTILPCLLVSVLKGNKRVYDAHELFCEMKEIATRPFHYRIWKMIEKLSVPFFNDGYTVCRPIADEFKKMYGKKYEVIRNLPYFNLPAKAGSSASRFLIYQGAVNEGRSFETLIPAMKTVDSQLFIYGNGNYYHQTEALIKKYQLEYKVLMKGKTFPDELRTITPQAYAGITLFENNGQSNYLSLANRFFDYIMAGIPQVCVDYPAYREINDQFEVALLIPDTSTESIQKALNLLLSDSVLYARLKQNCEMARNELNWQKEEKVLINFYRNIEN